MFCMAQCIQRVVAIHSYILHCYVSCFVRDGKKTYPRKDGEIKYNGKWYPEGDNVFPWEKRAVKEESNV